jgi:hypothetical protein
MPKHLLQLVALGSILFLITGCATTRQSEPTGPTARAIETPKRGEMNGAALGEVMVEKGEVFTYDALELRNQVSGGDGVMVKRFVVPPGVLRLDGENRNYRIYLSDQAVVHDVFMGTRRAVAGLAVSKFRQNNVQIFAFGKLLPPAEPPQIRKITVDARDQPSMKEQLVYNGRAGDSLKFVYRQFYRDMSQPVRSEDLQHDLRQGNVVRLKGLQLEVSSATGTQLDYKLVETFPDRGTLR